MRVFVAGASGALGSRLVPQLIDAGHEVIGTYHSPASAQLLQVLGAEPVRLDLYVKNVPNLLVKVFEVNTANYYRAVQREVDTDINLDGLVANSEQTHPSADPPLRRVARSFAFPQLTRPGVYVIDFIGNGKSSRALVRKGRLRPVVTTGTLGQTVTVLDEQNRPVPNAGVWLGNQEYKCDKDGKAVVPFTAQPGRRPVVLSRGEF